MKIVRIVCCFCLLLGSLLAILQPITALAARPPVEEGEERVWLETSYPTVGIVPGGEAEFFIDLAYITYLGVGEARIFDLVTTGPEDWYVYITEQYKRENIIGSVLLDPGKSLPEKIRAVAICPPWSEPGEYTITVEAISGELKASLEIKAVIGATYSLALVSATERYSTSATAGKDNYFSVELWNDGTADLGKITLSSEKPEGWTIGFSPDKVDSLSALDFQEVEVNIKPPPRAIAGDYRIFLKAETEQAQTERIEIRVTVKTPTLWGWVGAAIIFLVLGGIGYIFMRFSRR